MGFFAINTTDAHSKAAGVAFEHLINHSPARFIEQAIEDALEQSKCTMYEQMTVILPDRGASRYMFAANAAKMPVVRCEKKRSPIDGKLLEFTVPEIKTSAAIIIDDICDGGGTFNGIAARIPRTVDLYLWVTHGIFSKGFSELFKNFNKIYTSNSYEFADTDGALRRNIDKLMVIGSTTLD